MDQLSDQVTLTKKVLGWGVHFFTSLGMVCAAAIAWCIHQGGAENFRMAFVLMVVATVIDAVDGMMARAVNIKKTIPSFDGATMDNIIDFITFTFLPLGLIACAGLLTPGSEWYLVFPLLASLYGFCQTEAKTDDGYFTGFPSYWNIVALYLYILHPAPWISQALLLALAVLTFVPSVYLYPSRIKSTLNTVTFVLGAVWGVFLLWILWDMPAQSIEYTRQLTWVSAIYPAYYFVASWIISVKRWCAPSQSAA